MYRLLALVLFTGCAASAAVAQPARSFVASTGSDANACSLAAPCRTLQKGIDAVADGGDVLILDSGGFGSNVTITKSVSVYAPPGGQSRVAAAGNMGVYVQGPDIRVSLSGLGISGLDSFGIGFLSGASLSLRDMDINVMGGSSTAIYHIAQGGHLSMSNIVLRNSQVCLSTLSNSETDKALATIVNMRAENCKFAVDVQQNSVVAIQNSSASGEGIQFSQCGRNFNASGGGILVLDSVVSSDCSVGVFSAQRGEIVVSNSVIAGNGTAGNNVGNGSARSFGNNRVSGNDTDQLIQFLPIAEQ